VYPPASEVTPENAVCLAARIESGTMAKLEEYKKKRRFDRTPEPSGGPEGAEPVDPGAGAERAEDEGTGRHGRGARARREELARPRIGSEQAAIAELGTKRIYAVIVVPKGFQNDLENGNQARVILYTDDSEPGVSDQIESTLTSYVQNFDPNAEVQPHLSQLQRQSVAGVGIITKGAVFAGFNIGLTTVLAIVQIFAGFYEIAGGISREREDGTYARLMVSPIPIGSIVLGKTMFDILLTLIRTFTVLGISVYGYGARPNTDLFTLLALSLIVALVTMGIGFVAASLKLGQRAVVIIEFFLILFLFAFSGLIIDINLLVGASQIVGSLLPFTYAFDALKRTILLGRPLLSLTFDLEYLIGSILASYAIALVLLHISRERLIT
jgi:ABC-2 type transport system permease protein